jgi:uncharacterized protein (TIGR03435 family)
MIGRFCIAATLYTTLAIAQTPAAPPVSTPSSAPAAQTRPPAFDVVTVKPAPPGENWHFGFGKAGYSAAGVTLNTLIYQAYFGFNEGGKDAVTGGPNWVDKDTWDIESKVAPEDLATYERDRTNSDNPNPINRQMLKTMLADRFKLVVHRVPAQMPAFAIEVTKNGPKLTPTAPGEPQPSGSIPILGGGFVVPYHRGEEPHIGYYDVSMSTFAHQVRGMSGGPVIDRTGLTGRYDFTLTWLSLGPDEHEGAIEFDDPFPLSHWNFGTLGLKVERIQIPTEHIVIDHVEKPTEN